MYSRVTRVPSLAIAIGGIAILAAGCAAGSSSGGHASGATPAAQVTPQQALLLASHASQKVNSAAATISIQATAPSSGNLTIVGSFQEQFHPSVLAEVDFSTFSVGGRAAPGGMSEIITPDALYLRFATMMQAMHVSKPWAEFKLSDMGASGSTLQSLFSQLQSSSPATQTQMLATSKDARKVGTGVIDGVPVTEYAGTYSLTKALASLPASERAAVSSALSSGAITSQFKVWIDAQNQARKVIVTEAAPSAGFSETTTMTVTNYNQPVSIELPTAAETYVVPASALSGATG